MKQLKNYLVLFISALFLLSSCSMKEEIWLEKDGSGKLEITMDMSEMMGNAGAMFGAMLPSENDDSNMMPKFDENAEATDSSFTFLSTLPDSIKDGLEKPEDFERMQMRMVSNPKEKEMEFKMAFDFESFTDLDYLFKRFKDLGEAAGNDQNSNMMLQSMNQDSYADNYILSKKSFTRKSMKIDTDQFKEMTGDMEDFDPEDEKTQMMLKMFFGNATFSTVYHFPKSIKSVNIKNAEVDGKTVSVRYPFLEYMESGNLEKMEVKFKRR